VTNAVQLTELFDPNALAPGLYVVRSDMPAYGLSRALVEERIVRFRGEQYVTPKHKQLVFEVRPKRRANPSVKLTETSFQKATEQYADWKIKWWREAIQNATDAGATVIRCEAREQPDGTYLVSCEDNGKGMDRWTIENKMMAIGGSEKSSESVGGFGVAKNLLLFHWPEWEIHSLASAVRGRNVTGSDFLDVPMLRGTKITVRMPADKFTDQALAVAYITRCELPHITFYVNGEKVKANLKGRKLLRDTPEFKLYFNQGETKSSEIFIRARSRQFDGALYLFDMDLGVEVGGQILVDLLLPSVKILTDNRDGFNRTDGYWTSKKILEFAKELTIEGKAALRAKKTLVAQAYRGAGKFQAETREAEATAAVGATSGLPANIATLLAIFLAAEEARNKRAETDPVYAAELAAQRAADEKAARARRRYDEEEPNVDVGHPDGFSMPILGSEAAKAMLENVRGPSAVEAAIKQAVWRPDFYLHNEVEGFRVPKEFLPQSMSPRVVKLLSVWTDLCRFVMMQLASPKTFGVGFVFSTDAGAEHLSAENEDWLLINPYRDVAHQKMLLRPSSNDDLQYLYASAIHEATHMADGISFHGISFAYALTRNIAKCARGWKVVKRIERATKLGMLPQIGKAAVAEPAPRPSKAEREAEAPLKKHRALALSMRQVGMNTADVNWTLTNEHGLTRDQAEEAADLAADDMFDAKRALAAWIRARIDEDDWSESNVLEELSGRRGPWRGPGGSGPQRLLRDVFGDKTSMPRDGGGFRAWPSDAALNDIIVMARP
jgi:hypothetical protein